MRKVYGIKEYYGNISPASENFRHDRSMGDVGKLRKKGLTFFIQVRKLLTCSVN